MATGLSIATNLLSNSVQLNLDNNQKQLQNVVTQLSSGLRINTAADDPSGNAIATNLTSQYEAFNQASQNVQNANNAAQVALGALTQQTDILQRIRVLAVEAASDVNSQSDRTNLQAEVSQLLLEVEPHRAEHQLQRTSAPQWKPSGRPGRCGSLLHDHRERGAAFERRAVDRYVDRLPDRERRYHRRCILHLDGDRRRNDRSPGHRQHDQSDGRDPANSRSRPSTARPRLRLRS